MSDAVKTPLVQSMDEAISKKIRSAIQLAGKALPAQVVSVNGSIVTVSFLLNTAPYAIPNVTVPIGSSEYIRLPIRAGDKGVVFPADAHIGSASGLGPTTGDLGRPSSLGALTFFPIGNSGFSPLAAGILWLYSTALAVLGIGSSGVTLTGANANLTVAKNVTAATVTVGNGATGSFTAGANTVTVVDGIVTSIA